MTKCDECKLKFPDELISPLVGNNGHINVCGVCALKLRNEAHGLSADTPFTGEIAKQMYDDALDYRTMLEHNKNRKNRK